MCPLEALLFEDEMKIGRLEIKIIWHKPLVSPNNKLVAPRWLDIIFGKKR